MGRLIGRANAACISWTRESSGTWAIYANGEPWDLLNGGAITYDTARVYLTNRAFTTEDGTIPTRTLGLTISRTISGGMHEDLDITNCGRDRVRFQLEIASRSDFADIFEVKSGRIVRRGHITTDWSEGRQQLRTIYRNRDFTRALTIAPLQQKAVYANGRLSFEVVLEPGAKWHCCLIYTLTDGDRYLAGPPACVGQAHKSHHAADPLQTCCPDLDQWPRSWAYEARDIAPGRRMVECFEPFLRDLLASQLSRQALRRGENSVHPLIA